MRKGSSGQRALSPPGGIALERIKPFVLAQDPSGLRFSLENAQKDLGYYQTMAQDAGAHGAVAQAVLATLAEGVAHTPAGTWVPELVRVLAQR